MFCAPRRIVLSRMALETSLNAVNGGQITMSTSLMLANSIFSPRTRSSDSATVLFIFQLPAMISFRSLFISVISMLQSGGNALAAVRQDLFVRQSRDAGQHFT